MSKMIRRLPPFLLAGTLALVPACASGPAPDSPEPRQYDLVPWPQRVEARTGEFAIGPDTRVVVSDPDDPELRSIAGFVVESIRGATGVEIPVEGADGAEDAGAISLRLLDAGAEIEREGYRLSVEPGGVALEARTPAGLFYGVQTLRQLLPSGDTGRTIPAVEIRDAPRFAYRGMHLDVARHFFPVSFVKKYIDLLARYKFNRFHWHLTEDQGWRIEIERYPRLTQLGAFRKETRVGHAGSELEVYDGRPYGGYYTQEEIREVVAYAQERHVTIVPEIEMPGHSRAALAAYPELACTEGPFEVATTWGIFEDIYCPEEKTFEFLQTVLLEVMELFPGEYIHIGGDEAPKKRWEESSVAQSLIRREGLEDEHELQSYFIRRIERFLNAHGRKLIGWDEIIEGGLSPTATVMYWRDWDGAGLGHDGSDPATIAARQGNDLVMTPNQTLYFDHYQADPAGEPLAIGGLTTLEDVYAYEPVPDHFTPDDAERVLGAQANVWTEYMLSPDHVEYMVFPRLLALSEVVWSPREARDWASFRDRLPAQLRSLDALDVNYRTPARGRRLARRDASVAPDSTPRVIGYLASWSVRSGGLRIADLPADDLTHLFYAFGGVSEEGRAVSGDPCLDVAECSAGERPAATAPEGTFEELRKLKTRFPHLKVMISLGGWGGSTHFSDAAATPEARRELVASAIDRFLRRQPGVFDGIDVDWEFPVEGGKPGNVYRPEDRGNYTLLLAEFRRQLDALGREEGRRYELSIAASARPREIENLELDRLTKYVDFINVMTYDYHSGDTIAHFNAPLHAAADDPTPGLTVDASMNAYLDAGIAPRRLVLGIPFYGRGYGDVAEADDGLFQAADPAVEGEWGGGIGYRDLMRKAPEDHGFERHWHPEAKVPWLYSPQREVWISYDDPRSVRLKAEYARDRGLGGVMFWELGHDDGRLLRAVRRGLASERGRISDGAESVSGAAEH